MAREVERARRSRGLPEPWERRPVERSMSRIWPRGGRAESSYVHTPGVLNHLLTRVLQLEARWLRWGNIPFGTSLFGLARKPVP